MPELPEVETVVRGLRPHLVGKRIARLVQRRPDLRTALPRNFAARVEGRRVTAVERRAKYILAHLDDGQILVVHLGMSGRLVLLDRPNSAAGPHDHVEFTIDDGRLVRFSDPRRFGMMDLLTRDAMAQDKRFAELGPEPLGDDFTPSVLARALAGRGSPIKVALLDQHVVAGIGNIYACEALHIAGISPKRKAARCRAIARCGWCTPLRMYCAKRSPRADRRRAIMCRPRASSAGSSINGRCTTARVRLARVAIAGAESSALCRAGAPLSIVHSVNADA